MQYRTFGKLDWKPSALGFGAMRLPIFGGDAGRIDEPKATQLIRYAIDHGMNYVDTAYPYHRGNSETLVGRALTRTATANGSSSRQRCRAGWLKSRLTSTGTWTSSGAARHDRSSISTSCTRSTPSAAHTVRDLGVLDWAERTLADGRIGHLGFSFHDSPRCIPRNRRCLR